MNKTMHNICPVILCGGSGTRLWPLSRNLYPKQFIEFQGGTLFGHTLDRVKELPNALNPIIVCNEQHRFFASGILREKGHNATILLESYAKNTAPAIALAAFAVQSVVSSAVEPLLLVMPSDHNITPVAFFVDAVVASLDSAAEGFLLTYGIVPTGPECGFGYIKKGEALPAGGYKAAQFLEKPHETKAKELFESKEYLWNSGMFCFKPSVYLQELQTYAPEMYDTCAQVWEGHEKRKEYIGFNADTFAQIPADSIDYAVMEQTKKAGVVDFSAKWNDLGSWKSFYETTPCDAAANATVGDVVSLDSEGCYLHSSSRLVATLGVQNITVVETADAVLVMDNSRTQDVKKLLAKLKDSGRSEVDTHLKVYRPWGSYEVLSTGEGFQVKRIIVSQGQVLSLQLHHHRTEHWVVVRGTALVTNGEETLLLRDDQSTYIPIGVKHRLENPGCIPLEIIEVQSGAYLGEDDIVRFEDTYGRC